MIVVDSSVLIAWTRDEVTAKTAILERTHGGDVILGDLVFAEMVQGAPHGRGLQRLLGLLDHFRPALMTERSTALLAADIRHRLRLVGHTPRGTIELLIGAWCIEAGLPLLADDRDFVAMAQHCGLRLA